MRIIFTGATGVGKQKVIDELIHEILRHYSDFPIDPDLPQALNHPEAKKMITSYCIEAFISERCGGSPIPFLETHDEKGRQRLWRGAFEEIQAKIQNRSSSHVFLSMHLTFQRRSRFFSPLNWAFEDGKTAFDLIKEFNPDLIIDLIDNVYAVWDRIKAGSYFRLRELMAWRGIEMLMSDLLAQFLEVRGKFAGRFPFEKSPIFAVRHPPSVLYRLIFGSDKYPIIYLSFPISRTREDLETRKIINEFRKLMHNKVIAFDPLTIDEFPLQKLFKNLPEKKKKNASVGTICLSYNQRWPFNEEIPVLHEEVKDIEGLYIDEIEEIASRVGKGGVLGKSEIERNIELRDFRWIDQSDCVVVYRPQFWLKKDEKPHISRGVRDEISYAQNTAIRRVFFVHDVKEDGELEPGVFTPEMSERFDDMKSLLKTIEEEKGNLIKARKGG